MPSAANADEPPKPNKGKDLDTPWGQLPMPPWWVLLVTLLLLPTLFIGPLCFLAGWAVAWRWRQANLEPPRDARIMMGVGGAVSKAIFWPTLLYFSLTHQDGKLALFKGALWGAGKVAKSTARGVGTTIKKALTPEDSQEGN
ncbi:MAG: hypothetical protein KDB07_06490 [Planctomycetes bacterium]|nr:hypothetical protein [Planctomycetota bacterium]